VLSDGDGEVSHGQLVFNFVDYVFEGENSLVR